MNKPNSIIGSDLQNEKKDVDLALQSNHADGANSQAADISEPPIETQAAPQAETPPVTYGGFWKRLVAFLIDYIVTLIVIMLFAFGVGFFFGIEGTDIESKDTLARFDLIVQTAGILIIWLYYALMESSKKQATLGKLLLGMQVTDVDGNALSFGRATGRHFGKILSSILLFIGFIMIAFTQKKQGLHDLMAGALVINKPHVD